MLNNHREGCTFEKVILAVMRMDMLVGSGDYCGRVEINIGRKEICFNDGVQDPEYLSLNFCPVCGIKMDSVINSREV